MNWDNMWPPRWDVLWSDVQTGQPWALITGTVAGVLLIVALVAFLVRALRSRDFDAKANLGFGVVQTGVAYITITGGYEFFHRRLSMPSAEAGLLAGFIEACVWAAVGTIYSHGRGVDGDGKPNVGFGPAGGFFWTTVIGGGLLAILGSVSIPVAIGRIVIVVLGAYMWYLKLLRVTRRSGKPSRVRWTPKAFLLLIGAIVPGDEDVQDEAREWQVRKMARAIRWANSGRQPWVWLGGRALVKSAEQVQEDVLAEARRRYAAAYILRTQIAPESPVMAALLASLQREALGEPPVEETTAAVAGDVEARLAELEQARGPRTNGQGDLQLAAGPASAIPGARRAPSATGIDPAGPDRAGGDAGGRQATRSTAVPTTAAKFAEWLTIWQAMQSAPNEKNAELSARYKVGERTITNIRRAGLAGLLTGDHLLRLQKAEPAAAATAAEPSEATGDAPAPADHQDPPPPADPDVAGAATTQPRPDQKAGAAERRDRAGALVGSDR